MQTIFSRLIRILITISAMRSTSSVEEKLSMNTFVSLNNSQCVAVDSCDGSYEKPLASILEALNRAYKMNNDVNIILLDREYNLNKETIAAFFENSGQNNFLFEKQTSGKKIISIFGSQNKSSQGLLTKISMQEAFFSFSLTNLTLRFVNLTIEFLSHIEINNFEEPYFIGIYQKNQSSTLEIIDTTILFVGKSVLYKENIRSFILIAKKNANVIMQNASIYFYNKYIFHKLVTVGEFSSAVKMIGDKPASLVLKHSLFSVDISNEFQAEEFFPSELKSFELRILACIIKDDFKYLSFNGIAGNVSIQQTLFFYYDENIGLNFVHFLNLSSSYVCVGNSYLTGRKLSLNEKNSDNNGVFISLVIDSILVIEQLTVESALFDLIFKLEMEINALVGNFIAIEVSKRIFYLWEFSKLSLNKAFICSNENYFQGRIDQKGSTFYLYIQNSLEIKDSYFQDGSAYSGGVIYCDESNKELLVFDSVFISNYAKEYGAVVYAYRQNKNFLFARTKFLKNWADQEGGVVYFELNNKNILFDSCYFEKNSAYQFAGCIYFYSFNANVTIRDSIFRSNMAYEGGVFILDKLNDKFNFTRCHFLENSVDKSGGAVYIYRNNTNIYFLYCHFIENNATDGAAIFISFKNYPLMVLESFVIKNKALQGGFLLTEGQNLFFVNYTLIALNQANLLGAAFHLGNTDQLISYKCIIYNSTSFVFGAVVYSNNARLILFDEVVIKYSFSRIGAAFYVSDGSQLIVNNSSIEQAFSLYKTNEIFRIEGSYNILSISSSSLLNITSMILIDNGDRGVVNLLNNVIHFSEKIEGLFVFSSPASRYNISLNSFSFSLFGIKFGYFIYCKQNEFEVYIKKNQIPLLMFNTLIILDQIKNNKIEIESMKMRIFTGVLIDVLQESNSSMSNSTIQLSNCMFIINNTNQHFLNLKASTSLRFLEIIFYVSNLQRFSVVFNVAFFSKANNKDEAFFEKCHFLAIEKYKGTSKIVNLNEFSLLHFHKSVRHLSFVNSSITVRKNLFTSLIYLKGAARLHIEKCKIIGNYLNSQSSLIHLTFENSTVSIFNSTIESNIVAFGGLFSIENEEEVLEKAIIFLIKDNNISKNFAVKRGGIFFIKTGYLSQSSSYTLLRSLSRSLNFTSNRIRGNRANLGSVLFWDGLNPQVLNSLTQILVNPPKSLFKREIFGSSTDYILVYKEGKNAENDSVIEIEKKVIYNQVLKNEFYFCAAFFDKFNNIHFSLVEIEFSSYFKSNNIFLLFNDSTIALHYIPYSGKLCAYKIIFIKDFSQLINKRLEISIKTNRFSYFLKYLNSTKVTNYQIIFEIADCQAGELFNGEICIPCERNKYYSKKIIGSLQMCIICTDYDHFNCYGGNLRSPKVNYWRINAKSELFLRCPSVNCLGDRDFEKNGTYLDCESCFLPGSSQTEGVFSFSENYTSNGSCKLGYQGILCTECADEFASSSNYRCADCSSKVAYVKQAFLTLVKVFIFYYSNIKTLDNRITTVSNLKSTDFIENVKTTYMLKIIFKHFTILNVLNSLPFEFSGIFDNFFVYFIDIFPSDQFSIFSFECIQRKLNIHTPTAYASLVLSLIYTLGSLAILMIYGIISNKSHVGSLRKLIKVNKSFLLGILFLFTMDNIVIIISPFVRILFCLNVGDEKFVVYRILQNFSLECWDRNHLFFTYTLALPLLSVTCAIIPIFIIFKLLRARASRKLFTLNFLINYGYFYYPYRKGVVFYEFLIIFAKIALVTFKELFVIALIRNNEVFVNLLFIFFLSGLYFILKYTSPFSDKYQILSYLDKFSLLVNISNAMCALVWSIMKNDNNINFTLLSYVILANSVYLIVWIRFFFRLLKGKIKEAKSKLRKVLDKLPLSALKKVRQDDKKDYLELSKKLEEKNKFLKDKIRKLKLINKLLITQLENLEIQKENINEEGVVNSPTLLSAHRNKTAILPAHDDLHSNPELQCDSSSNRAEPDSLSLEKIIEGFKPKMHLVSTDVQGETYFDHSLIFTYKLFDIDFSKMEVLFCKCDSEEFVMQAKYYNKLNSLLIVAKRTCPWLREPFQKLVALNLQLEINQNHSNTKTQIKIPLEINYSLFLKVNSCEWFNQNQTSDAWECIASQNLDAPLDSILPNINENSEKVIGKLSVQNLLMPNASKETVYAELYRHGRINIYGSFNKVFIDQLLQSIVRYLRERK